MREDIVTTKVYPFDELSDEAKETVIEKLAYINAEHGWWDSTYEDAKTIGLVIEEFDLDRNRQCAGEWTEDAEDVARLIIKNRGEQCETYKTAWEFENAVSVQGSVFMDRDDDAQFIESDQYEELCEDFLRDILEDYSIILQKESEYLQSEEAIIETIEANEYEFTEDGELY